MGFVLKVIQDTSDVKNNVWMSSHLSFVRMSSILFISLMCKNVIHSGRNISDICNAYWLSYLGLIDYFWPYLSIVILIL